MLDDDFGVIIACSRKDWPLALGALASVQRSMPEVPVCLLVDGDLSPNILGGIPGVHILNRNQVRSPVLREKSFGWGLTKMVAFWESPFERFLLIDPDTCMRGDLRPLLDPAADLILDQQPPVDLTDEQIGRYWFDPHRILEVAPGLSFRDRELVNVGVYAARRGIFDLEDYLRLVEIWEQDKRLLRCGDQGILNILAFQAADAGRITLAHAPLQTLIPNVDRSDLEARYPAGEPHSTTATPTVLHWCGPDKPWIRNRHRTYVSPMTWDRMDCMRRAGVTGPAWSLWLRNWLQEWRVHHGV